MKRKREIGPAERAARALALEGEKRRVLLSLCAYVDEGNPSPGIASISRRARVHRMATCWKLRSLERDGFIRTVEPGGGPERRRAVFALSFAPQPDPKETK